MKWVFLESWEHEMINYYSMSHKGGPYWSIMVTLFFNSYCHLPLELFNLKKKILLFTLLTIKDEWNFKAPPPLLKNFKYSKIGIFKVMAVRGVGVREIFLKRWFIFWLPIYPFMIKNKSFFSSTNRNSDFLVKYLKCSSNLLKTSTTHFLITWLGCGSKYIFLGNADYKVK